MCRRNAHLMARRTPKDSDPFTEIGFERSRVDRARHIATAVIEGAVHKALTANMALGHRERLCWHILWAPLTSGRKLAPYPKDPFQLKRWPALIHDVRRHVRRALPPKRTSREAWPPAPHVVWQEAMGIMLGRSDLAEHRAGLAGMSTADFAKVVKRAWSVGPTLTTITYTVLRAGALGDAAIPLPVVDYAGERVLAMGVQHYSFVRLRAKAELAARASLRRKLGRRVWRIATILPVGAWPLSLRQAVADETDTYRLSLAETEAMGEAQAAGRLGGRGDELRWDLSAAERSSLRGVLAELQEYGRVTRFVTEYLIRDGKPTRVRPRRDHPIRQSAQVRRALRWAYKVLRSACSDPLGELVDVLSSATHRLLWLSHDVQAGETEASRRAARRRLREMIRRQLAREQ